MENSSLAEDSYERWLPQFRKGLLEMILLLQLVNSKKYGYQLAAELRAVLGTDIAEGTLYPLLNRLKRDGLVIAEWQTAESGAPRKYYTITPIGEQVLHKMKVQWSQMQSGIMKVLMQS